MEELKRKRRIKKISQLLMVPPGTDLVEIVNITNFDGSELRWDNWRRELIGKKTTCYFTGGFRERQPIFHYFFDENDGEIEIDIGYEGNGSLSPSLPVEIEPNVFTFETQTSIYTFRLLDEEEVDKILNYLSKLKSKWPRITNES